MADGEEKPELVSKGKLNALEEIVDDYVVDAGKKLVIFARFRPEIDIIGQMLKKKKLRYGEIYGDVKLEDRGDIVKDFQTNPETMVFLAQIDTAGLGITLTAADTCVYYSVNFNYAPSPCCASRYSSTASPAPAKSRSHAISICTAPLQTTPSSW